MKRQVPVWHNSLLHRDTQMSILSKEDGANGSVLNFRWKKNSVFRLKAEETRFNKGFFCLGDIIMNKRVFFHLQLFPFNIQPAK